MRKMRKALAAVMAAAMVLSMGVTAFAEVPSNLTMKSKETTCEAVIKAYDVVGAQEENTSLYPAETLTFISTPAETNPDATNIGVADLVVTGNSDQKLTINVPAYNKVGVYTYTIAEIAGSTQGVAYTDGTISVSVLVEYDYDDVDADGYGLKATIGVTAEGGLKHDTFTNTYSVGSLCVSKTVSGNLASKTQKFDIDVTFTSDKEVLSAISYGGDSLIAVADWVKEGDSDLWTVTKTISISHGEDVTFNDIPAGVSYSVNEQSKHAKPDDNGSDTSKGYTVTYSEYDGKIAAQDADSVIVTNNKGAEVDTGILLDSAPYVLLLAVAVLGMFGFILKKRNEDLF